MYIVINRNNIITYVTVRWYSSIYIRDKIAAKKEKCKILKGVLENREKSIHRSYIASHR